MIVNWKKEGAGVLVVPLMKNGVVFGKKTIIPGNNLITDAEWEQMRDSCIRKIEAGHLVPVTVKTRVTVKNSVPAAVPGSDDPDYIPYSEVCSALSELGLFADLVNEKKAEEGGNGALSKKWLKSRFEKEPELRKRVFDQIALDAGSAPSEETKEVEASVALKDMAAEKAVAIIVETYDETTLREWQKAEGRDEVRAAIANQIEELGKPPTKEKRGIFGKRK